ncbi:MAG: phage protein GemA/Gp16 family protein [Steroidobacteraceae bacterium]
MTDADRYDLQLKLTGVTSCRDMDLAQLQRVDRELRRLLRVLDATPRQARGRRTQRDERRPAEPPTKEQMDLIAHLAQDVRLTLAGYRSLCTRTLHHSWPQTREEANKITECLKAMQKRGWHPTKEAT